MSSPRVKTCKFLTVHLNFTDTNPSQVEILFRIRRMSSVVVVDDISPVVRTGDVDRIRYRGAGVVGVPKTQSSVLVVCCVGDVHGKSQEGPTVPRIFIYRTMIKRIYNVYKNK